VASRADASIVFDTRIDPTGFKNGLDNIDNSFEQMRQTLVDVATTTEGAFDEKSQRGIDTLTQRLARQIEQVDKARSEVEQLREEYSRLSSGEEQPKSVINMQKELAVVNSEMEKEVANNERLLQLYLDAEKAVQTMSAGNQAAAFIGDNLVSSAEVAKQAYESLGTQLEQSGQKLDSLGARSKTLSATLQQIKLDPTTSQEARETAESLDQAAQKANRLAGEAQITEKNLKNALNPTVPNKWTEQMNRGGNATRRIVSGIGNIGRSSRSSTGMIEKMVRRLLSMAKSLFIFALFRKALSSLKNYFGELLKSNEQFQASLNTVKVNLKTAFQPIYQAILPALNSFMASLANVTAYVAKFISMLFGQSYEASRAAAEAADEEANAIDGVGSAAKKASRSLQSFDEVNKIQLDSESSTSKDSFKDAPITEFDPKIIAKFQKIIDGIKSTVGWIRDNFDKILDTAVGIGVAIGAWKVAQGLIRFVEFLSKLKLSSLQFGFTMPAIGSLGLLGDLTKFLDYFNDFKVNGATFHNIEGMFSEFVGMVGDIAIILGNTKLGASLKIIQGVGEIINAIEDIANNGINWDNALTAIRGLTNIGIGIGIFTGNLKLAGWSLAIQGFTAIIGELSENWEAIKNGDWSGVDIATMVVGILQALGGIAIALDVFSKVKGIASAGKAAEAVKTVGDSAGQLTTATGGLSGKLTSLAKNLGMGLVVIVEVAAAAALIVGAIWVLGKELEQVGIAWQPVIDNAGTIAIAMGIGVAFLAVIGVVTALLGSVGAGLIVNIALGTAILLEIGLATALFLVEIWAIGKGLDLIGQAWQPVLDNGENIAIAIGIGTGLLLLIGAATALLGVATVASAGLLPLAIAIGTAVLLELGIATGLFIIEIVGIGLGLQLIGEAWQPVLDNGETIAKGIELGTALLVGIGVVTAALGVASVASVGLLPLAIAIGTGVLIELSESFILFTEELVKISNELSFRLSPSLAVLNANMPTLETNLKSFLGFMGQFAGYMVEYTKASAVAKFSATVDTIIGWFTKDPIQKLSDDVNKNYNQFMDLNTRLNLAIPEMGRARDLLKSYTTLLDEIQAASSGKGKVTLSNDIFINMKDFGKNLTSGLAEGIKQNSGLVIGSFNSMLNTMSSNLNAWINNVVSVFNQLLAVISKIQGSSSNTKINAPQMPYLQMPKLAQGGLIPPNKPRPVIVGDSSEQEIVSPRSAIREEVLNALSQLQGSGRDEAPFVLYLDGEVVYKNVIRRTEQDRRRTGFSPVTV